MQYYNICLIQKSNEKMNREKREALARVYNLRCENADSEEKTNGVFRVMEILNNEIHAVYIALNQVEINEEISKYSRIIGFELKSSKVTEITGCDFERMTRRAPFDIDIQNYVIGSRLSYYEEDILELRNKASVYEDAGQLTQFVDDLLPELDRIYKGSKLGRYCGNPVNYIIRTGKNSHGEEYEVMNLLLAALYDNRRVITRRYATVHLDDYNTMNYRTISKMYKINLGGIIIFDCDCYFYDDEDTMRRSMLSIMEDICSVMGEYRNQVLTIFCISDNANQFKNTIVENLQYGALVEINEKPLIGERTKEFLRNSAKKDNLIPDSILYRQVDHEKSYSVEELEEVYAEWMDKKLRRSLYPQYKNFECMKGKLIKEKDKGNAYKKLENMIGLKSAKEIINKVINAYRAQQLFAAKGLKTEDTTLHMVFTGNPGTAKTTVARLFAQILRDNEIVSTGTMVEVGRGDLVGKYVGWTAKLVEKKFQDAKGGILFIDEAYSLVDDKDGLYGDEAINTIVQLMENNRSDVIVIFAGYPDKMEQFLDKNPGLRSRIAFHVHFDDYTTDELCQIAELISEEKGVSLTEDAREKVRSILSGAKSQKDYGNGRYVRNIIEKAKMAQNARLLELDYDKVTSEDIRTIIAEDIVVPDCSPSIKRVIGF